MRKLASIRKINNIEPVEGADRIEVATVDGWKVVIKRGEHFVGESVIYCEVDSWIPHTLAPFLSNGKEPKVYEGVKGERLRTIRLRKQLSQGLILPMTVFEDLSQFEEGQDVSDILGVQKWEKPIPVELAGQVKGTFPSFIKKTDQERIQNCFADIPENIECEVSLKLDGSSMTVYINEDDLGVCSRNMDLNINEENSGNTFIRVYNELRLDEKLNLAREVFGFNMAIQGELMGEGVQGNREGITGHKFFVFDVFDIDSQSYVNPDTRYEICDYLGLDHVPVIEYTKNCGTSTFNTVEDYLGYADRPSLDHKIAEGVVFKSWDDPNFSWKAISNKFLLKCED